jgi:hypothetical protein
MENPLKKEPFLIFCLLFYSGMAILGLALAKGFATLEPFRAPRFHQEALFGWGAAVLLGITAGTLSGLSLRTRAGRRMVAELARLLPDLNAADHFVVALASGIGEELLFRGALLPLLGLPLSSCLFGAMHWPFRPSLRLWTGYALVMGFAMGGLALATGCVWFPVITHAVANFIGFRLIARLRLRKGRKTQEATLPTPRS